MSAPVRDFPIRVVIPVAISSASALLVSGLAPWALLVMTSGFIVRVGLLWFRRELVPSRFGFALSISIPSIATAWVVIEAHRGGAAGPALVSIVCALLGLALASPPTFGALSRLLGLSLAQIAGAALLVPSRLVSAISIVYAAVLVPVMVRLATAVSAPRRSESLALVRRITAVATSRPPSARGALGLLGAALPLGLWFFMALPHRSSGDGGGEGPSASSDASDVDSTHGRADALRSSGENALDSFVSGGKTSMRLGFVSKVQKSQKPVLLVTVDGGVRGPEPLTLRGRAYDVFTGNEWTRSSARVQPTSAAPDADGWVAVAKPRGGAPRHFLLIEDRLGEDKAHLFLAPEPVRVRMDPRVADRRVAAASDGIVFAIGSLPAGGTYEEEAELPPDRSAAHGRRSDASVAPDPHVVEAPPESARYREIARRVVLGLTDASERAARIESWLQTTFAYTTDMPEVARTRPVLDFLERIHRGHCEYFASSMALLMRSLGHATRLAVGFRGGDYLTSMNRWSFRGSHAHAWCEVYYEGPGWVAYDPTPALDMRDVKTSGRDDASDDDSFWEQIARFSADDRRRLALGAGQWARALVASALAVASVARWPTIGLVLAAIALVARTRRSRARSLGVVDDRGRPLGPYGMALAILAKAGIRRRESETGGDLARRVAALRPGAVVPLVQLIELHESARFGGVEPTRNDLELANEAVASVRLACDSAGVRAGHVPVS